MDGWYSGGTRLENLLSKQSAEESEALEEAAVEEPTWTTSKLNKELIVAAHQSDLSAIKKAIADGADVNVLLKGDVTILMLASMDGHVDVVKLLLEAKANVNTAAVDGMTALQAAIEMGQAGLWSERRALGR